MNKASKIPPGSAAERIVKVASELFYSQGYRATGINEVIQKSGVAKATFYNHFPTKDDLCRAYLQGMKQGEKAAVEHAIASAEGPVGRFLAVMASLGPWLQETDYRGCPFMNMASEVPDPQSPLRREGVAVYDWIRRRVEQLSEELIASDAGKYGHLEVQALVSDYMLVYGGAVMFAEIYHALWPVEQALETLRRLIGH